MHPHTDGYFVLSPRPAEMMAGHTPAKDTYSQCATQGVLFSGPSSNLVHNSTRETEHTWPRRYRPCSSMTSMVVRLRAPSALGWMVPSTRSTSTQSMLMR